MSKQAPEKDRGGKVDCGVVSCQQGMLLRNRDDARVVSLLSKRERGLIVVE